MSFMRGERSRKAQVGRVRAVMALGLLIASFAFAAQTSLEGVFRTASPSSGDDPFRVSVRLAPARQAPGHPVVAVVEFSCPQGHYIYEDSISVTLGETFAALPVNLGKLRLPPARSKYDKLLREQVRYLDGRFDGELVVELSKDAREGTLNVPLEVTYQGCSPKLCFRPVTRRVTADLAVLAPGSEPVAVKLPRESPPAGQEREAAPSGSAAERFEQQFMARGLLVAVLIAFVAGLGLTLTPCVYPMIPITMAVIGAAATQRRASALARALVYVLGISVTYALLGVIAAAVGRAFGTVLQHPAVYLVLAVLFAGMAVAMSGAFDVQVPMSWSARLQAMVRGRWGLVGVFLLGLLSGVAVTPCGAPVVLAAMSYVTKTGRPVEGFVILFAIAWGMGTPLVVLGVFGGLLKSLPKSGGWQETVKLVFAAALLAGALYFVWMSSVLSAFWFRMVVGAAALVAAVFVGAFDKLAARADAWGRVRKALGLLLLVAAAVAFFLPALSRPEKAKPSIQWLTSEPEALQAAVRERKPVMLYFWQQRCRECVTLADRTFPDRRVVEESAHFTCLKFNGTDAGSPEVRRVLDKYGIKVFPTMVFISGGGEVLADQTVVGYVDADALLKTMRLVSAATQ